MITAMMTGGNKNDAPTIGLGTSRITAFTPGAAEAAALKLQRIQRGNVHRKIAGLRKEEQKIGAAASVGSKATVGNTITGTSGVQKLTLKSIADYHKAEELLKPAPAQLTARVLADIQSNLSKAGASGGITIDISLFPYKIAVVTRSANSLSTSTLAWG